MPSGKKGSYIDFLNPSRPDPGRREKINLNFFFLHFFVEPQKVLWWPERAFILILFYSTFWNARGGMG